MRNHRMLIDVREPTADATRRITAILAFAVALALTLALIALPAALDGERSLSARLAAGLPLAGAVAVLVWGA